VHSPGLCPMLSFESPILQSGVVTNVRRLEDSYTLPLKTGNCKISENSDFDDYDSALNFKTNLPLIDPYIPRVTDNLQVNSVKLISPSIEYKGFHLPSSDIDPGINLI